MKIAKFLGAKLMNLKQAGKGKVIAGLNYLSVTP
jgi:hypothetical protein